MSALKAREHAGARPARAGAGGKASPIATRRAFPPQQLELLVHLIRRDVLVRYRGSVLGVLWSVFLPLAQLAVLVFVFQRLVPLDIAAYPAFVFAALLPWSWFSSSLGSAAALFLQHRDLVRRPHFAPPLLVVVTTSSHLLTFLAAFPLLVGTLLLFDRPPSLAYAVLPVLLLLQGVFTVGLGLAVATWNVFYRDVQHLVTVVLSLWFYLTPVFYELTGNHLASTLSHLNPMALLVGSYRAILCEGRVPPLPHLALTAGWALLAVAVGWGLYRRYEDQVLDEV